MLTNFPRVFTGWKPPFPPPQESIKQTGPNLLNMSAILMHFPNEPDTYIPFWNNDVPILFIAGQDDQVCNSVHQVEIAEELLNKAGKKINKSIHKSLGHLIDLPFSPPTSVSPHVLFPKPFLLEMGGSDFINHGQAQEKIWLQTLTFFKLYL